MYSANCMKILVFIGALSHLHQKTYNFNLEIRNDVVVTAIKCIENDPEFARFAYCSLKPISRNVKHLSLKVVLLKPPVTKSNIYFRMLKRANGFRPFPVNVRLDICKYFAGSTNPVFDWFYNAFKPYSNINHTCPYESDMIVDKMPVNSIKLPSIFPDGDYRVDFGVDAFDVLRATVQLFATIKEKQQN